MSVAFYAGYYTINTQHMPNQFVTFMEYTLNTTHCLRLLWWYHKKKHIFSFYFCFVIISINNWSKCNGYLSNRNVKYLHVSRVTICCCFCCCFSLFCYFSLVFFCRKWVFLFKFPVVFAITYWLCKRVLSEIQHKIQCRKHKQHFYKHSDNLYHIIC